MHKSLFNNNKISLIIGFVLFYIHVFAQEGTRESDAIIRGNIITIPFESYMYMSEIDKKINEQTGWEHKQIKEYFRRHLDIQLMLILKSKGQTQVVSFYKDSVKMAKDLDYTYKSRVLNYQSIDEQGSISNNNKPPQNISNGQLTVEMRQNKGYMNVKVINPNLLNFLNKKYGSEYFIFINELDIKYNLNAYDIATDAYQREVSVHFTILDKNQKVLTAGILTSALASTENNPKKIVETSLIPIAERITQKFLAAMH